MTFWMFVLGLGQGASLGLGIFFHNTRVSTYVTREPAARGHRRQGALAPPSGQSRAGSAPSTGTADRPAGRRPQGLCPRLGLLGWPLRERAPPWPKDKPAAASPAAALTLAAATPARAARSIAPKMRKSSILTFFHKDVPCTWAVWIEIKAQRYRRIDLPGGELNANSAWATPGSNEIKRDKIPGLV